MMTYLDKFICDEDGAITVDWVVLSASMVALALASVATIRTGIFGAATNMATSMANIDLGSTP